MAPLRVRSNREVVGGVEIMGGVKLMAWRLSEGEDVGRCAGR